MARTFKVGELVTLAQQYSDQENSDFISQAEWRGYLSSGYAVLHSILVESGARCFEDTDLYTTGSDPWLLPEDFLSYIGVDYLQDGTLTGRRWSLREFMAQERNLYAGVSGSGYASGFYISNKDITLQPTPGTGQVYALVYVPQPVKLTDDDTVVDVVTPDGEQFLLWYATFMARDKEDSDVRSALRERREAEVRLREWAVNRAMHAPRRPMVDQLIDSYDGFDDDPGGYRWAGRWNR